MCALDLMKTNLQHCSSNLKTSRIECEAKLLIYDVLQYMKVRKQRSVEEVLIFQSKCQDQEHEYLPNYKCELSTKIVDDSSKKFKHLDSYIVLSYWNSAQ